MIFGGVQGYDERTKLNEQLKQENINREVQRHYALLIFEDDKIFYKGYLSSTMGFHPRLIDTHRGAFLHHPKDVIMGIHYRIWRGFFGPEAEGVYGHLFELALRNNIRNFDSISEDGIVNVDNYKLYVKVKPTHVSLQVSYEDEGENVANQLSVSIPAYVSKQARDCFLTQDDYSWGELFVNMASDFSIPSLKIFL